MSDPPRAIRDSPLVTVAVAAFNVGPLILQSVRSVLDQTYRHLEVIVVDDGSTDGSPALLATLDDPRLTVIHQENQGKSVALNRIRSEAHGKYLAVHDGDDLSHPDRIRRQVEAMEANPELGACFTRHDLLLEDHRFAARRLAVDEKQFAAFIERVEIPAIDPTGMYRTSCTVDLDYDPALRIGQGIDYILRVGELHPVIVLGDSLYSYRIVADSTTRRSPEKTHEYIQRVADRAALRRGTPAIEVARPRPGRKAQHAFVGHIIEATFENALAGSRREAARIALTTMRHTRLGLDGLKPAVIAVLPSAILRRLRPDVDTRMIV